MILKIINILLKIKYFYSTAKEEKGAELQEMSNILMKRMGFDAILIQGVYKTDIFTAASYVGTDLIGYMKLFRKAITHYINT
jgi:hypothetical protein